MTTQLQPVVTQFGFSTQQGVLSNLVDGDDATFWRPYPDNFAGYTTPVIAESGGLFPGPHPCIQFDFGTPVRIPMMKIKTETDKSLGPGWLIASDFAATSVNNVIQGGDVLAGVFTAEQMTSGNVLETYAKTQNIRKRYWRILQNVQP